MQNRNEQEENNVDEYGNPIITRARLPRGQEIIGIIEQRLGKMIPIEELEKELEGKLTKDEIEEAVNKLATQGEIFRPRRGFIARTS